MEQLTHKDTTERIIGCAFKVHAQLGHGFPVGEYFADLLIESKVICELKAAAPLTSEHEAQLVNYLAATGMETGLLINFGRSVSVKRKFRTYRPSSTSIIQENPVNPEKSC